MNKINVYHKKRGIGEIIKDDGDECKDNEVLVKFKNSWDSGSLNNDKYAKLKRINLDIFSLDELKIL